MDLSRKRVKYDLHFIFEYPCILDGSWEFRVLETNWIFLHKYWYLVYSSSQHQDSGSMWHIIDVDTQRLIDQILHYIYRKHDEEYIYIYITVGVKKLYIFNLRRL